MMKIRLTYYRQSIRFMSKSIRFAECSAQAEVLNWSRTKSSFSSLAELAPRKIIYKSHWKRTNRAKKTRQIPPEKLQFSNQIRAPRGETEPHQRIASCQQLAVLTSAQRSCLPLASPLALQPCFPPPSACEDCGGSRWWSTAGNVLPRGLPMFIWSNRQHAGRTRNIWLRKLTGPPSECMNNTWSNIPPVSCFSKQIYVWQGTWKRPGTGISVDWEQSKQKCMENAWHGTKHMWWNANILHWLTTAGSHNQLSAHHTLHFWYFPLAKNTWRTFPATLAW